MCMTLYRNVRDRERSYLSEAGSYAFDEVRRLYMSGRIQMVDCSIRRLTEHVVTESDLVVDVCNVLIGLPSRSFRWSTINSLVGFSVLTRGGAGGEFRRVPDSGTRPLLPARIRVVS